MAKKKKKEYEIEIEVDKDCTEEELMKYIEEAKNDLEICYSIGEHVYEKRLAIVKAILSGAVSALSAVASNSFAVNDKVAASIVFGVATAVWGIDVVNQIVQAIKNEAEIRELAEQLSFFDDGKQL